MIDKIVPPLRGKDAPRLLITKYGALSEDSSLPEHLDQEFVNWIKKYRTNYPTGFVARNAGCSNSVLEKENFGGIR